MKVTFTMALLFACLSGSFSVAQDAAEEPEDAIMSYVENLYDRSKLGINVPGTTYLFFLDSGEIVADVVERGDPNRPEVGNHLSGNLKSDGLLEIRMFKPTILNIDTIVRVEQRNPGRFGCRVIPDQNAPTSETGLQGQVRTLLNTRSGDGDIFLFEMRDGRSIPVYYYRCADQSQFRLSGMVADPESTVVKNSYSALVTEWFDMEDILAVYSGNFRGAWN